MNYELAMMALEGLARSPMSVGVTNGEVVIEAEAASFKEFARLCLLLGSASGSDEAVELRKGVHMQGMPLRLQLR
jgi:hypothetical protein